VIALDTNLLVYAHRRDSPWHAAAAAAIAELAHGRAPWAIAWPCLYEFFAITTHPRIYAPPSPAAVALVQIDAWLEAPNLHLLAEGDGHWPALRALLERAQVAGPLVHDARVAALCLRHGVTELWSADRDFGRFAPLKVRNPLVSV
jgi:toxin-antitoxin system PIN domain toxin